MLTRKTSWKGKSQNSKKKKLTINLGACVPLQNTYSHLFCGFSDANFHGVFMCLCGLVWLCPLGLSIHQKLSRAWILSIMKNRCRSNFIPLILHWVKPKLEIIDQRKLTYLLNLYSADTWILEIVTSQNRSEIGSLSGPFFFSFTTYVGKYIHYSIFCFQPINEYTLSRWNLVFSYTTLLHVQTLLKINKNILLSKYPGFQKKDNMSYKSIETISIIYTWKCRHLFSCQLVTIRFRAKSKILGWSDWI